MEGNVSWSSIRTRMKVMAMTMGHCPFIHAPTSPYHPATVSILLDGWMIEGFANVILGKDEKDR